MQYIINALDNIELSYMNTLRCKYLVPMDYYLLIYDVLRVVPKLVLTKLPHRSLNSIYKLANFPMTKGLFHNFCHDYVQKCKYVKKVIFTYLLLATMRALNSQPATPSK